MSGELERVARDVKAASRVLATLPGSLRDAVLDEMAEALERRSAEILAENRQDVDAAKRDKLAPAMIDRLLLDEDRIADMAVGIRTVRALPDPVGAVEAGERRPNGLEIVRRRVPFGVIAFIFEARPNALSDAVALCIKSGNAVILRTSRVARRTARILAEVLTGALVEARAPRWAIALLGGDHDEMRRLVRMEDVVDLVVPRGGSELKAFLKEHARVPVIYAAAGNNHVYVHEDADVEQALKIAVNSKVSRPGVCNAAETLLVHAGIAKTFLPQALRRLAAQGVEVRVDPQGRRLLGTAGADVPEATAEDFDTEYLDLVMAVRVVPSLDEAIDHIDRHGSGHSEAIVTRSLDAAMRFQDAVDAAVVLVNASTRFTDGGEFGMGAEIAISTQKLHARGPIGLPELTTYKYLVTGHGQIR
ncbi:MAG: glutamate-5-semialdehyde dehydrogenase [Thermoleophilia bacterium]